MTHSAATKTYCQIRATDLQQSGRVKCLLSSAETSSQVRGSTRDGKSQASQGSVAVYKVDAGFPRS
jgi:hypothetical protein